MVVALVVVAEIVNVVFAKVDVVQDARTSNANMRQVIINQITPLFIRASSFFLMVITNLLNYSRPRRGDLYFIRS